MSCCQQEKICEDSASFDLTSADIASAISELNQVLEKLQAMHVYEDGVNCESDDVPGTTAALCLRGFENYLFVTRDLCTFKGPVLLQLKNCTLRAMDHFLMPSYTGVTAFSKQSGFLAHPVYIPVMMVERHF